MTDENERRDAFEFIYKDTNNVKTTCETVNNNE